MTEKKRILIVDDSPVDIQFIMENLKSEFAVLVATDAKKAIEIAENSAPDVILMDVVMPEMNGYEACKAIKQMPEIKDIEIIFVSSHDTIEEKLAGYDAGGSDYLTKPVNPKLLLQKIELVIENRARNQAIEEERSSAFATAMVAMKSGGELGVVLDFLRNSFSIMEVDVLAQKLIDYLVEYGLEGSIQIRQTEENINLGMKGFATQIEQDLMDKLHTSGRIVELGNRLVLNFGKLTLLIKNLPLTDPDYCGRIRDHLAIMMEGAQSKLSALETLRENEERKHALQRLVIESNTALQYIDMEQKQHKKRAIDLVNQMFESLESSFLSWGLDEEQEKILMQTVQLGFDKSFEHYENGTKVDKKFENIIAQMKAYSV